MTTIGPVLGHYRILRRLSASAMGEVYEAEDTRLGRRVALKTLPAKPAPDPVHLRRFETEARALASLNHPGIVTIYSVEGEGAITYLTMELVDGQTLDELIPVEGLPAERFFPLAIALTEALAAAHSQGVVHRDLKPGNVMMGGDGRLKVLDFGLAKLSQGDLADRPPERPLTGEGQMLGTVPYMSPEQARGLDVDQRSDLFSLGIMLYEMATGGRPFRGATWGALLSAILTEEPPPASAAGARLPPEMDAIVARLLAKDPARRFQSADEVRLALQKVWQPELVPSRPTASSSILVTGLVATVVVISTALAFFVGTRDRRLPTSADGGIPRIVVLPFAHRGGPEKGFLAAGITEEITSRLGAVSALGVISRLTADRYADSELSVQEIGRRLEVDFVLEGSVQWESAGGEDRVRVTPQLVRVEDDRQIWSARYDRVIHDLLAVQSEIAEEVIAQLGVVLLETEREVLATPPTSDIEAYQAYLRGMDYARRRDPTSQNWTLAEQMFERAVEIDPEFAVAWAELSEVHSLVFHLKIDRNHERLERALRTAQRALEIDPELPQGHRALGYYHYWGHRDYERALESFARAAEGLPNDSELLEGIAYIRRRQGRFDEALALLEKAFALDPGSAWLASELGATHTVLRHYPAAIRYYDRAIAAAPDQPASYQSKADVQIRGGGDLEGARKTLLAMPDSTTAGAVYAWFTLERLAGHFDRAFEALQRTRVDLFGAPGALVPRDLARAWALAGLGDDEGARAATEAAVALLEIEATRSPEDARVWSALGLAYAESGRPEEAITAGKKAVELAPIEDDAFNGPAVLEQLAVIYATIDRPEDALTLLEQLLSIPSDLSVPLLQIDPRWDGLRGTPGFAAILKAHRPDE